MVAPISEVPVLPELALDTAHKPPLGRGSNNAKGNNNDRAKVKVDGKHVRTACYHLLLLDLPSPLEGLEVDLLSKVRVGTLTGTEICTP